MHLTLTSDTTLLFEKTDSNFTKPFLTWGKPQLLLMTSDHCSGLGHSRWCVEITSKTPAMCNVTNEFTWLMLWQSKWSSETCLIRSLCNKVTCLIRSLCNKVTCLNWPFQWSPIIICVQSDLSNVTTCLIRLGNCGLKVTRIEKFD